MCFSDIRKTIGTSEKYTNALTDIEIGGKLQTKKSEPKLIFIGKK